MSLASYIYIYHQKSETRVEDPDPDHQDPYPTKIPGSTAPVVTQRVCEGQTGS